LARSEEGLLVEWGEQKKQIRMKSVHFRTLSGLWKYLMLLEAANLEDLEK